MNTEKREVKGKKEKCNEQISDEIARARRARWSALGMTAGEEEEEGQ